MPTVAAGQLGAACTSVVCRAVPAHPPYNPAAHHTYEGLVHGSRTTRGLAAVTRTAPPATTTANSANAANPVEAPSPPSSFRQAMGLLHALACPEFYKVFNSSEASFESFGLIFKISIGASYIKN